ncbi:MAG: TAXI family TRAP transporter solute-binding subunit [Deltaproteobacteria bacterium]|nr:MAG: TAXI family TRAP transporter solute-binding subunit [Deltaproteobacteria bacterium]
MRAQWNRYWLVAAAILFALLLLLDSAQAQTPPRSVGLGSNPPGSIYYSLASGLANVVSNASLFQMTVQPYTGSSTYLPLIETGELEFGMVNAVDMALAYQGPDKLKIGGRNPYPHTPSGRLIMRGSPLQSSLVVRKDSPIKTIHDVKGKRVTGEYPAQLAVWYNIYGSLANGGLSWNDVKVVPVPAVNEGVDALVQGRADVTTHAIGSAKIKEADVAIGIRYLSLDCSPQAEERMKKAVPGYYLATFKAGSSTGIVEDICGFAYDIYMIGHKGLPDAVVQGALKAIWDNIAKLPPLHPSFKDWTRERAATYDATLPYHPAAVQFYKEKGIWSAKMDEAQRRLLAMHP